MPDVEKILRLVEEGAPDEAAERIRSSIRPGLRGAIVDIATEDRDRVLIVNE